MAAIGSIQFSALVALCSKFLQVAFMFSASVVEDSRVCLILDGGDQKLCSRLKSWLLL